MMDSKIFIDGKGKVSSKRVIGILLMLIVAVMSIDLYIVSRGTVAGDAETSLKLIYYLLFASSGLLGIGTFEKKN